MRIDRRIAVGGLAAGMALLEFVVPWWVPPLRKVASDSYLFGFSNAACILGLGAGIAVVSLLCLSGRAEWIYPERLARAAAGLFRSPDPDRNRIVVILVVLLGGALPFLFWLGTASSYFGESGQFLNAMDQIVMGKRPYVDFSFAYGPLFLYGPIALSALTGGAVKFDTAYFLWVSVETAAGLAFLSALVRRLDVPRSFGMVLFLLLAFAGCNLTLGENYTPFRFLFPFASMIAVHGRAGAAATTRARVAACAVAGAMAGFAALISPEIGLVTTSGLVVLCGVHARQARILAAGAVAAIVAPAVVAALCSKQYLFSLFAFGGGGYNFPVLPTPHILFYVATVLLAVPLLVASGLAREESGAPLALGIAVGATMLAAAALGRCDPGHVYWNGLVLFAVAAAILVRAAPRAGWVYLGIFGALFTAGIQISFWNHYSERLGVAFAERKRMDEAGFSPFRNGPALWARGRMVGSPFLLAKMPTPDGQLRKLERYPKIGAPIDDSEIIDRFLKLTGKYVPERVPAPVVGILTEDALARKLEDVSRMEVLLFPTSYRSLALPIPDDEADRRSEFLSKLLVFPVRLRFRNEPFLPQRDVVKYVLANFHTVDSVWDIDVMVRNDLVRPSEPSPALPPAAPLR